MIKSSKLKVKSSKLNRGFTLMELLIYISLVSIIMTGAIMFAWDIIYGREKANSQKTIEQNARIALTRIIYEIKKAKNIQTISAGQLVLNNDSLPATTINYNSSQTLQITSQGQGPYNLTSNQIRVLPTPEAKQAIFKNLTTTDTNSKNIAVNLTIRPKGEFSGQFQAVSTMSASIELNGQFNQARSLLTDASNTILASSFTSRPRMCRRSSTSAPPVGSSTSAGSSSCSPMTTT